MKQLNTTNRNKKINRIMKKTMAWILILCFFLGSFSSVEYVEASSKSPYYIKVNRKQNCVTVYGLDKNGKYTVPVKAMTCSVGTGDTADHQTPAGTFRIYAKYRWRALFYGVYGQYACRINGPIMFHSVPYTSMSPGSLQYQEYNKLGKAASHGCIRLSCQDAGWIYRNCPNGTKVKIYDSDTPGPLGKPETLKISSTSKYRNWDPTDSNAKNPWRKVAPKFSGLKSTRTVERCSSKSCLLSGVKALNFKGQKVKVTVSGSYNLKKEGSYKLTYKAKDYLGNSTTKKVTLRVKDTTKPTLYRTRTKVTLDDEQLSSLSGAQDAELSQKELNDYFRSLVIAKDSAEVLGSSYITVNSDRLYEAYQNKQYGTIKVSLYAKDKAGNRSVTKEITVLYQEPVENESEKEPVLP